ncbi:MAG TPA: IS6 family transposase, partial [Acetobacteraceae bacterium]|nr:IS6 family transposase [Acetobacteraceae bacterium]
MIGSWQPAWDDSPNPYRGFRYPAAVIEHAVWLYHCFSISLRDVELILAGRGIVVSYESIREWGLRFGRMFANELKRRRPRPGDKWHMDEVFIRIRGKLHYLWRAVDQHGHVLDVLVQSRRNTQAAKRFFGKLLKGLQYVPRGDRDRQAAQLRCGRTRDPARRRASPEPLSQQSGRGVAPADAPRERQMQRLKS